MRTDWEADYLDGVTPTRQRVKIRLTEGGLQIRFAKGPAHWWSYDELRLKPVFHAGDPLRLERGGEFPETLQISDPAFPLALRIFAPGLHTPLRFASRRLHWRTAALLVIAGILAVALVLYLWLIPAMASFVAPHVPISWEEELGGHVLESIAPRGSRCTDEARLSPIAEIARRLEATLGARHHAYRVIVVDEPELNAVAVPGGTIVIFQGLLDKTETPGEVAGVLAHEMQHVAQRHIMKLFLEQASTGVILSAMTGDGGEALAFGFESARMLGLLRYSRGHESEADSAGLRMLEKAGIDPRGMIAFFETLKEEGGAGLPAALGYLSTHPHTPWRIDALRRQLPPGSPGFTPLLPDLDWERARQVCQRKKEAV